MGSFCSHRYDYVVGAQGARANGVDDVGCADAAMVYAIVYSAAAGMARCGLTDVGRFMGCVQTWGSLAVFLQAGDTPTVGFQLKLGSLPCALYSRGVGKDAQLHCMMQCCMQP